MTLQDLTIRKKLTLMIMFTCLIVIFLACVTFVIFDYYEHRQELIQGTQSLAKVIGNNCQAALKFDIPEDAEKMLSALIARPSVTMAYIHDSKGNAFASYFSPTTQKQPHPPKAKGEGYYFIDNYLEIHKPIIFDGSEIGSVCLKDDMCNINKGIKRDILLLTILTLTALLVAYTVATKLQAFISRPILSLAQTAKKISNTKDYSLRALKENNDEVGKLTDDFNHMITEVQASDNALRESELRFRDFFENAPIGFHIFGPDQTIIDINDAELKMIGYSRQEIIGKKNLTDLIIPSQKEQLEQHWQNIITKGFAKNLEYTFVHKKGHHINVILNVSSRFDENGKLINTRGSVLNITKRKKAERRLKESEKKIRTWLEHSPVCTKIVDLDFNLQYMSTAGINAIGIDDVTELYGKPFPFKYYPESFHKIIRDNLQSVKETGSVIAEEIPVFNTSGNKLWFNSIFVPVNDDYGRIEYFIVVSVDITERKKAEQQIEVLSKFPNENPSPVLRISTDGILLYANDASKYLLDEWKCKSGQEIPGDIHELIKDTLKSDQKKVEIECQGRIISFHLAPIVEENYANMYGRDITERKHVEQEREEFLKVLASQKEELESIIFVSSHDLKSPIFNIAGFSGELTSACTSLKQIVKNENLSEENKKSILNLIDDDIPESLNFIKYGTSKLKTLLDALLKVSRITRKEMTTETLDMDEMLDRIKQSMAFQIKEKGMTLTIEKLPKCIGDKSQIDQVFTNLIDNAIKYRDPNKKETITVSAKTKDDRSIYCVKDNGMGMAEYHQKKIFELFHRLNPKDNIEGQGLGLTIAKRILQKHNGDIWVESTSGKGSAFFVALPKA